MDYISDNFKESYPEHFSISKTYSSTRILYQFQKLSDDYFETLKSKALYLSDPRKFNDPFDCWGQIAVNTCENEKLAEFFSKLSKGRYSINDILKILLNSPDKFSELIYQLEKDVNKTILSSIRFSCLSSAWNNELMWSHYADNHNGVCLALNISDWKNNKNIELAPVQYKIQEPINLVKLFTNDLQSFKTKAAYQLCYTKNPDWHYEKEWRIASNLVDTNTLNWQEIGLKEIEIIFGIRVTLSTALSKINELKNAGFNCKFSKVDFNRNGTGLVKIEI